MLVPVLAQELLSEPEQVQFCNPPDCRLRAYTKPEQVPTNVLPERALQNAALEQEPELLTEGLPGVPARYREPINDTVILSGVSGYLNMVDLPTLAKELCATACALRGDLSYEKRYVKRELLVPF